MSSPSDRTDISDLIQALSKTKELAKLGESRTTRHVGSPQRLKKLLARMNHRYDFVVGDLVRWKEGLKDRKLPAMDEPAIVVSILAEPIRDTTNDAGTSYFRNCYDIVLGVIHPESGNFVSFHYESMRFEPYDADDS